MRRRITMNYLPLIREQLLRNEEANQHYANVCCIFELGILTIYETLNLQATMTVNPRNHRFQHPKLLAPTVRKVK